MKYYLLFIRFLISNYLMSDICLKFITYQSSPMTKPRRGRDRMVVGFTTTCALSAYCH